MPTLQRAIDIITDARKRGDLYAGRFADFAAAEIAKVESVKITDELYSLACRAFDELDKGKTLMDCVRLQ